ncbi:HlyD family type I secretion periplasmic adaptor subunit [Photobacterium profundum]|uniref:Membrane fusion protein (MFP) family protein n=1 Tax=Photobacterium profundum 3TCK TaxID=314280 RepID=Q1Z578_9GAMM|nr:HlyD family type I secretion periplasmic adaptor subunit [Photobacterium profundum]EAS43688.1 type I secretion membrane fusion protein, HlyD [Photobacterium profundum 3TCK]PSV64136.1 HlyD family type I secretion periplasmic adaptor subunit [Photobacterium profundum]
MDKSEFDTNRLIWVGCIFIILAVGGFILWATTAKLSSASVASGTLVVESQRKKVQHLEGGWVKAIYVSEGQKVKVGDVLVELANSRAESDFRRLILRAVSLQAQHDRLSTELSNRKDLVWSNLFFDEVEEGQLANIINSQQLQYQQSVLHEELREGQYQQRKVLLQEQIRGTGFQLSAIQRQLDLANEEIQMTMSLLKKGFVSKTRVLEIKRYHAGIDAQKAELEGESEVLTQQLLSLKQGHKSEIIEFKQGLTAQLEQSEKELRDVKQALKSARDVRERVKIRSEHTGTVVGLNVHSVGGVVNAGDVIMEIVPDSDALIVEAVVKPEDIDVVRQGLTAKVRLSAYNIRRTPPVQGEVIYVAADRLQPRTDNSPTGYVVKVKLDSDEIKILGNIELYPGMPTEVFILLEDKTLWDYLTAPLFSSYYRAFRES